MRTYPGTIFFKDSQAAGQLKALRGRYFQGGSFGNGAGLYADSVPSFEMLKYRAAKKPPRYLLVLSLVFLVALSAALLAFALREWRQTTQVLRQTEGGSHSSIPARYKIEISTF